MGFFSRYIAILSLTGACQLARTLPEPVPLDFSCQAQIEASTLYANNQPQTKITLTLTPNNEGTQASSLTLTEWSLPEGLHGLLLDEEGKAVTIDTPLAWGTHTWHYSPVGIGEHLITLHLREPYEKEPRLIALAPIQVLEDLTGGSAGSAATFAVSAWMRACASEEHAQVHGGDKDVVALELRLSDIPAALQNAPFKLRRWQLPQGLEGVLENAAGERLEAFPLSAEVNTFFLSLDRGHHVQEREEPLRLWVAVPGGMTQEKEVSLHWRQTSFPFDLTLTAEPIQLFEHQKTPVTLTITPQDPQKQTTYALDALTLSHGQLEGAGSGVVLVPGAVLASGEHPFLFSCPNNHIAAETRVNIRLTVSNTQGDQKTIEQVLTVKPVQFSVNAWLRELSEEEQVISGDKAGLAVEVRLEEVDEALRNKSFTLQDCVLPHGFTAQFTNKAKERLRFFPLSVEEPNTFFLVFEADATIGGQNPVIGFQVKGPHRQRIAGQADCALVQQKLFVAQAEHLFNQLKPDDSSALEDNMALLRAIDRLGGTIPERISRALARIRPGIEAAHAVQEAIEEYGSKKQAVHHLCYKRSLTRTEKLVLRRLVTETPGMLLGRGRRPLRVAAYRNNLDAVRVLVAIPQAIGGDVDTPNSTLLSSFMDACYAASRRSQADRRHFEAIFDALIEVSSIRNERDGIGRTPLIHASGIGALTLLKKLVNKGVEVTAQTTNRANYRVYCPVARNRVVWYDDNTRGGMLIDVKGWTALHEATAHRHTNCVNFLKTVSADWPSADSVSYRFRGKDYNAPWVKFYQDGFYLP